MGRRDWRLVAGAKRGFQLLILGFGRSSCLNSFLRFSTLPLEFGFNFKATYGWAPFDFPL